MRPTRIRCCSTWAPAFGTTARRCPPTQLFRGTCLLTHLHWDHVQGLPFFTPLLREGSRLDVYGPAQDDGRSLDEVVSCTIRPPLFPVSVDELPGTVSFHDTADTDFSIGEFNVKSRLIPHLGPTLGFRVEHNGRSIAYLSDHQQPFDGSYSASPGALELIEGVDLLIHDAQYTQTGVQGKGDVGPLHHRLRRLAGIPGRCKAARTVSPRPVASRRRPRRVVAMRCRGRCPPRAWRCIAASEGLVVDLA